MARQCEICGRERGSCDTGAHREYIEEKFPDYTLGSEAIQSEFADISVSAQVGPDAVIEVKYVGRPNPQVRRQ